MIYQVFVNMTSHTELKRHSHSNVYIGIYCIYILSDLLLNSTCVTPPTQFVLPPFCINYSFESPSLSPSLVHFLHSQSKKEPFQIWCLMSKSNTTLKVRPWSKLDWHAWAKLQQLYEIGLKKRWKDWRWQRWSSHSNWKSNICCIKVSSSALTTSMPATPEELFK